MNIVESGADLRHLRAFVTLSRTLNFSRAADELYLTQPAMSRIIQELERDLGAALFVRDHRHVELSVVGAALLPSAQALVEQFDSWIGAAGDLARGQSGTLRIGLWGPSFFNYRRTAEAMREFRAAHPGIEVEIAELFTNQALEALRNRLVEVSFARQCFGQEDVVCHTLRMEPLICLLPAHHRLAKHATLSVGDLQSETVLMYARGILEVMDQAISDLARRDGVQLQMRREFTQLLSIYGAVEARGEIALLPESGAPPRHDRRFAVVPFEAERLQIPYVLAHLEGELSPAARAFVDLVLQAGPAEAQRSVSQRGN